MSRISSDQELQLLEDFARHPGWQVLNDRYIAAREKHLGDLARKLFSASPTDLIDQHEITYWRGYFRGQRALLNDPKLVAKKLAADRQGDDEV